MDGAQCKVCSDCTHYTTYTSSLYPFVCLSAALDTCALHYLGHYYCILVLVYPALCLLLAAFYITN